MGAATIFGAKIEQQYIKYYRDLSTGGWIVYHKDGNVFYYGSSLDSRQINSDSSVFKWCLDKIEDTNGNLIELTYDKIGGTLFLNEITYDANNRIEFELDSATRPDQWETYDTHFPVTVSERLGEIRVYGNGQFTTRYKLEYETPPSTNHSRLKTIRRYGDDDSTTLPAVTFDYRDGTVAPIREDISNLTFGDYIYDLSYLKGNKPAYGDFNGDGLTDILVQTQNANNIQLQINQGDGEFTASTFGILNWENADINTSRQWATGDLNGDGKADVVQLGTTLQSLLDSVITTVKLYVYYTSVNEENGEIQLSSVPELKFYFGYIPNFIIGNFSGNGSNDIANISNEGYFENWAEYGTPIIRCSEDDADCPNQPFYPTSPDNWNYRVPWTRVSVNGKATFVYDYPYTSDSSNWITADINNDGRTDIVHFIPPQEMWPGVFSDAEFRIWRMRPDGYFDVLYWSPSLNSIDLKTVESSGSADFNGDGLSDFYGITQTGQLAVFFSDGQTFKATPVINNIVDISNNISVGDFNGDGLQDLFGFNHNHDDLHVFVSRGDGTFNNQAYGLNLPDNAQAFGNGDFDGDGKPDFLTHKKDYAVRFFSTQSIGKPDILEQISYEKGATIDLEYVPSSRYKNKKLPFVIPTLSKMTIDDGVNDSNDVGETTYLYGGGLYSYEDREFRGFAWAEQYNPYGSLEKNWFHQDRFRQKIPYKIALYASKQAEVDGDNPLIVTTNSWQEVDEQAAWGFVKLADKTVTEYDNPAFPNNLKETYTYDNAGNLILTETEGSLTNGANPSMLNVTKTTPWVQKGTATNPWIWRQQKETLQAYGEDVPSREATYTYDNAGNVKTKTSGTSVWAYDYDSYGNVRYEYPPNYQDDPSTYRPTEYQYDDTNTYIYKIINGKGYVVEKHWYTHLGVLYWEKDVNGKITDYDYDEFGRLTTTDYPIGETLKVFNDYCLNGDCTDVQLPWKVTTRVLQDAGVYVDTIQYYDGLGRPVQTVTNGESGQFVVSKIHYDAMGRKFLETGPFYQDVDTFATWPANTGRNDAVSDDYPLAQYPYLRTIYDQRSRPLFEQTRDDLNGVKEKSYVYDSKNVKTTDADDCFTYDSMDVFGQIVKSETSYQNEDGSDVFVTTWYGYNSAGDLTTVKNSLWDPYNNPDEGVTTINYDVQGRKTSMDDPDMGFWQYQYDKNGNLKLQTDNNNDQIQWTYDALDRPTLKDYLDTDDASVVYQYDTSVAGGAPTGADIAANRVGYLYSMTKGGVSTVYNERDNMGRELLVTQTIEGQSSRITNYDYYANGTVKQLTYPHLASVSGSSVTNVFYPGSDLLHTVTGSDSTVYATMTNYHPTGKMGDIEFGNGVTTSYQYDDWSSRLDGITTENASGVPIMERLYYYSPAGDIEAVTDSVTGVTHTYTYDKLHRLVEELSTDDHIGITPIDLAYEYEDPDHLHAVSNITINNRTDKDFYYDPNGNMTTGWDLTDPTAIAERSFDFNGDDMPKTITHSVLGQTSYLYDGDNRRAKKISLSGTTYYYSSEFEIINNEEIRYVFAGNLRVAKVTDAETVYFHKDHLNSSAVVTSEDGTTVIEDTDYLPFGGQRRHSGSEVAIYRFTDQELDSETGLYNYDARLYDPVIVRFVSADSVVPDWYNSQAHNRYSYTLNNPLIYTDPSGHQPSPSPSIESLPADAQVFLNSIPDPQQMALDQTLQLNMTLWGFAMGRVTSLPNGFGGGFINGNTISKSVSLTAKGIKGLVQKGFNLLKGKLSTPKSVSNPVPDRMARVIPGEGPYPKLGPPGRSDVFVTAADDIAGMNAEQISQRLTINPNKKFTVIEFDTPSSGVASPINRPDPGFIGGGRTAGGAREFVIPNQSVPSGSTVRIVQ